MVKAAMDYFFPPEAKLKVLWMKFHEEALGVHTAGIGTTGAGKTQVLLYLIDAMYKMNQKNVIFDMKEDIYRALKKDGDKVFCPWAKNTVQWNIFNDIDTLDDINSISYTAVPVANTNDPFWDDSARALVQASLLFLKNVKGANNMMLWNFLSQRENLLMLVSNEEIRTQLVADFGVSEEVYKKVSNYLKEDSGDSKMVDSIIGTLMSKIKFVESIKDMDGDFSFKKFIKANDATSLYFIVPEDKQVDMMNLSRIPLELMIKYNLSLPDDKNRRINYFLDEFSGLVASGRIDSIIQALERGRSKGVRIYLFFQTTIGIKRAYGDDYGSILDLINTWFIFRTQFNSKEMSEIIGDHTVIENNKSISVGLVDMADRLNVGQNEKDKPLVPAYSIKKLENLEFYTKSLGTDWLLAKVVYKDWGKVNEPIEFIYEEITPTADFDDMMAVIKGGNAAKDKETVEATTTFSSSSNKEKEQAQEKLATGLKAQIENSGVSEDDIDEYMN